MSNIPRLQNLPYILQKYNDLSRIQQYLSTIEEHCSFFHSIQNMIFEETHEPGMVGTQEKIRVRNRSRLEGERAQGKIRHQEKLCGTFIRQYENLVQLVSTSLYTLALEFWVRRAEERR